MFFYKTTTPDAEQLEIVKDLRSQIGRNINDLAAQQKEFAKNKDFESARSIADRAKRFKSFQKALEVVCLEWCDGTYVGHIPHINEEQIPYVRTIDWILDGKKAVDISTIL